MAMSNDKKYVPHESYVRHRYISGEADIHGTPEWEGSAEFDRFLDRVRWDALTALADHWDETVSGHGGRPLFSASGEHVRRYRDARHPDGDNR